MPEETAVETQATELLRTLIRNGCVNTGEAASGHEDRSVDALEDFFAGSGLSGERYTSQPGRMSLITRIEGRVSRRVLAALQRRGHHLLVEADFLLRVGHTHAIVWRDGTLWGGADPRGDGAALGF